MTAKSKSCIMLRDKGCRKFKMVGQGTGFSTWVYDWARYVERGDGDVVVVDAVNAREARVLARALLDGEIKPTLAMGFEGVKTRMLVHGGLSLQCFIGAQASCQTWDRMLAKHGKVPTSHTKPVLVYEKLVKALQERASRIAPRVYIRGSEVVN
jgi:hypothetical protein